MKKILSFTGILLFLSLSSIAQNYKFGKVSIEELEETQHPIDSTAKASILYENRRLKIEYNKNEGQFELITKVHKRIKLYDKDGFEHATEEVLLYKNGRNQEEVEGLKAITYTLEGGSIVETKLKKDGIFESEISDHYDQEKFTMPALKEGAVIEYKYTIISPFIVNIDRIYLQSTIPIKKLDVKLEVPEYYKYKKFTTGYLPIDLKYSSRNDKITFVNKTRTGTYTSSTSFSSNDVQFVMNVEHVVATDVPAFKKEPYCGNAENYISSLSYELASVEFPNRTVEERSRSWEDVVNTIYKDPSFGKELKKTDYFEEDLDALIGEESDPMKRIAKVYNFVKNKMTWNKRNAVIATKGVKAAYKEGVGNAAEINLMLIAMLDYAKINVNPVVLSTSDRIISLFPSLKGFNYVVARVKLANGTLFYLDATDPYGLPNILPDRVVRGYGRVIAKNGTSQAVSFRPTKPSFSRFNIMCELDAENAVLKGKFNVRRMDYSAHSFRVAHGAKDVKEKIESLQEKYGLSEVDGYEIKGIKKFGKGVDERLDFQLEDQLEVVDDEIFFSPLLFLRDKENIFKSENRKYPVDFAYAFGKSYMVNIKIPKGYEVVECPKSARLAMPDNMGKFSFTTNVGNGQIQVLVDESVTTSVIPAEKYGALKEFYNQIVAKENEQVVLKKI